MKKLICAMLMLYSVNVYAADLPGYWADKAKGDRNKGSDTSATGEWLADPDTGCRVWNPAPSPSESIKWSGACSNNTATGRGTLQWYHNGKPRGRMEGEFQGGKLNGKGFHTNSHGDRFEGNFVDSNMMGRFVLIGKENNVRQAPEGIDNKHINKGSDTLATGEWIADPDNGCRVWNSRPEPGESIKWSGACSNNLPIGKGKLQWYLNGKPNGSKEGEFRDGKLNGRGIATNPNGDRFEGNFVNNIQMGIFHFMGNENNVRQTPEGISTPVTLANNVGRAPEGTAGKGQWITDKKSGCGALFPLNALTEEIIETKWNKNVWTDKNASVTDAQWKGTCTNGVASGEGKLSVVFKIFPGYMNYPHVFHQFGLKGTVKNGVFDGEVEVTSKWHDSFISTGTTIVVIDGLALSLREYIRKTDPARHKAMLAEEEVVRKRQAAERAAKQANRERAANTSGSASQGEQNFKCKIVCRTSGFVSYETKDLGEVRIKAYPSTVHDKMSEICNKLSGNWYPAGSAADCKPE